MAQTNILTIKAHLTYKELTHYYRSCKNPTEKTRWQLVWLMANPNKPMLVLKAAKTVGFCQRWARQIVHRYNKEGINGLQDQRINR